MKYNIEFTSKNFKKEISLFIDGEGLKGTDKSSIVDTAIEHACTDMMARTLKTISGKGGIDFKNQMKRTLTPVLKSYFNSDNYKVDKFNDWHHDACETVLRVINDHYTDEKNADKNQVRYGKAQKIVNMSMKYLYCFSDETSRKTYFENCHMPIDSYIIKWIKSERNSIIKNIDSNFRSGKIPSWSSMQYSDFEDVLNEKYTYNKLCTIIRCLVKDSGFTPLEAEFIIWPAVKKAESKISEEESEWH